MTALPHPQEIREEGSYAAHESESSRDCRAGELDEILAAFAAYCRKHADPRCTTPRSPDLACDLVTRTDGTRDRLVVREWCGSLWRIEAVGWRGGDPIATIEFHGDCD